MELPAFGGAGVRTGTDYAGAALAAVVAPNALRQPEAAVRVRAAPLFAGPVPGANDDSSSSHLASFLVHRSGYGETAAK
jgi:hypothetical protein